MQKVLALKGSTTNAHKKMYSAKHPGWSQKLALQELVRGWEGVREQGLAHGARGLSKDRLS